MALQQCIAKKQKKKTGECNQNLVYAKFKMRVDYTIKWIYKLLQNKEN